MGKQAQIALLFVLILVALELGSAVPVSCTSSGDVLSDDLEEFIFEESLGNHHTEQFIANPQIIANVNFQDFNLANTYKQKFLANILLQRRLDKSRCSDKKVCEYNCETIFPRCSGKDGFLDFTTQYNQNEQQQLAYNWVCKRNLFSSKNQKTSYFSIIFRVLVTSVTEKSESDFQTEVPNADVTKYDSLFIDWNENKNVNGNDIAVLRALDLYKEGLKGFLLLCSQDENGFADIEAKLDQYEQDARDIVDSNNQHLIDSDSTASAQQEVDSWRKLGQAISAIAREAKAGGMNIRSFKSLFKIKDPKVTDFNKLKSTSFLDRKLAGPVSKLLTSKGKNDRDLGDNDYARRVVLYNQLKESLRNSFIEMVQGNTEQRDFCQCSDFKRFFDYFNKIPASVASDNYGIHQDQLGYQYQHFQNFENICRSKCPATSKCANDGIKQKNGVCSYNLFDLSPIRNQRFPIQYKPNEAFQFEMSGNDVSVLFTTGTRINSLVYVITLGGWDNKKSSVAIGKIGKSGTVFGKSTYEIVNSTPFTSRVPIWITFYNNEIKVGRSSIVGSGQFMSHKLPPGRFVVPSHVGFGKHPSAPRSDILNARFEPCSGNGKRAIGNQCACSIRFSGQFCENYHFTGKFKSNFLKNALLIKNFFMPNAKKGFSKSPAINKIPSIIKPKIGNFKPAVNLKPIKQAPKTILKPKVIKKQNPIPKKVNLKPIKQAPKIVTPPVFKKIVSTKKSKPIIRR